MASTRINENILQPNITAQNEPFMSFDLAKTLLKANR